MLKGDPEFTLITCSSDGQLMFLLNKLSKMKHHTPLGSRIAKDVNEEPLVNLVDRVAVALRPGPHLDFKAFLAAVQQEADRHKLKLTADPQRRSRPATH